MPGLKPPTAGSSTRLADLEPSAFWLRVESDGRSGEDVEGGGTDFYDPHRSTPSSAEPTAHPQVKACVFGFPVVRMESARSRPGRAFRDRPGWRRVGPAPE